MKRVFIISLITFAFFSLNSCASIRNRSRPSLSEAIEMLAEQIAAEIHTGSRVVIGAFNDSSETGYLSDYIIEELRAALMNRDIEFSAPHNFTYVSRELLVEDSSTYASWVYRLPRYSHYTTKLPDTLGGQC